MNKLKWNLTKIGLFIIFLFIILLLAGCSSGHTSDSPSASNKIKVKKNSCSDWFFYNSLDAVTCRVCEEAKNDCKRGISCDQYHKDIKEGICSLFSEDVINTLKDVPDRDKCQNFTLKCYEGDLEQWGANSCDSLQYMNNRIGCTAQKQADAERSIELQETIRTCKEIVEQCISNKSAAICQGGYNSSCNIILKRFNSS